MAPKKVTKDKPSLVTALDFIALAQRDKGAPYQTHVLLRNNYAVAYDGVLAAGHHIEEDLNACPHTMTLVSALKKCKTVLSVTQLDASRLSVKSGRFKAFVPCQADAILQGTAPDPVCGQMTNAVRDALLAVSPLIVENSQRVITASALIRSGSVIATTGHIILECWHGLHLPELIVPKLFINALAKITKDIVSFGFSQSSLTVYFDNGSWLKTQLYNERWPDCDAVMAKPHNAVPLPIGFYEAFNTVESFVEDGRIFLKNGRIQTNENDTSGASYEVDGLVADVAFSVKHLKLLDGRIKTIDFIGNNGVSYFYGDGIRGALTQMKE